MSDQPKQMSQQESQQEQQQEQQPRQIIKSVAAAAVGVTLELLSGLSFTGAVIMLVVTAPLMVIFSPILVPAAIVLFLIACGFFFSGGCGMAAVTVLTWMYNYVTGKHPVGADKLDSMMETITNKVKKTTNKAQMSSAQGQYIVF